MNNDKSFYKNKELNMSSEEFDIANLLNLIIRRKFVISAITIIGFLFSFNYARQKDPIYEGEFQIVLENQGNQNLFGNSSSALLSGLGASFTKSNSKSLKTEVNILKSSSVLKPVYEYVVKNKYNNDFSKTTYKGWINSSLQIQLVGPTSVLEIKYKDSEKKLIEPVLNQISKVYQQYSYRDKENDLKRDLIFLENQLEKTKLNWEESIYVYQEFALKHSLGNRDGLPIESKLSNVDDFSNESTKDLNTTRYDSKYEKLIRLENNYTEKSTFLKPNSEYLKGLKLQINRLEKSLAKPKEILVKYRSLKRDVLRNETALGNLENQIIALRLGLEKDNVPWELISETTIKNQPVAPKIKQIVFSGLISSFILSLIISYLLDLKSGLVYKKDLFGKIFQFPLLFTLPLNKNQLWDKSANIVLKTISLEKSFKGLNVVYLGSSNNTKEVFFCEYLKEKFKNLEVLITKDFSKINESFNTLVICSSGTTFKKDLTFINQEINLLSIIPTGWIYLENQLDL